MIEGAITRAGEKGLAGEFPGKVYYGIQGPPGPAGPIGKNGEDGGYYTPVVTQLDEDTIQFDFTPSRADMPAVDPVTVELPVGQGSGGNAAVDSKAVNKLIDIKLHSVSTYGAKGDGTTDDTAAFQNALANNRVVTVPGGTYKLSGELVIRDNCQLELSQDVVLDFTNTSGNCITLNRSAYLKGNHATVMVPYAFTGKVVNADTSVHTNTKDVPPFTHWDPQWKTARYLIDLNICKADSYGLHESLNGDSNGTAVYVAADGDATSTFIWGLNFSGLRIAGSFEYGIRAVNFNDAYNHEMRIEALIDACKIGVSLEDCNNAYVSAIVQPRKANNGTAYATNGIQLIRCENTDLSGSRVWDWNEENSLWSYDKSNVNQHISMYGNCMGTILNDYNYHYLPSGFNDLRELIYTDTPANFDSLIILQEPFTRWFRPVDKEPYFNDGYENKRLMLKEEFDGAFQTDMVPKFTNVLATASDGAGSVFNGIGYTTGGGWGTDGKTFNPSQWHSCTGYIPCKQGDVLHVEGMSFAEGNDDCRVVLYDANFNKLNHVNRGIIIGNSSYFVGYTETENGFDMLIKEPNTIAYITLTVYTRTLSSVPVISVNEEIKFAQEGFLADGIKVKSENVIGNVDGGNVDYVGVEPAEDDMPKVFITGVKPTTKDDVLAEMQYISKTEKFHAYLEIKCQGTSSMSYPKKNFTVKLYSDEARETKLKKDFKDWNHESNKFVLKANYIDHSHARNIVSARLWSEIVASRPDYTSLPVEMRNAPNNGAVDGFPIKVYYNGNYEGVYTWNIGKDDWMWGMDKDNANHVLLCAEGNTDGVYAETPSNFRALWNGVDGAKPGWSVEVGTNSAELKTSLNNLIQFVMDNDGDDFRNGISTYLDIQSAIDYYIFQYEICGSDGLAHNMLLATYDGVVWRCGAYDLDATFGLFWNGGKFVSAEYACPEDYQEQFSLLWERIEANFLPELKARQAELRKTVLSYSNMVTHFERFMDIIGLDLYAEDLTIYSAIPSGSTNNIKQIRNYIRDRQAYVDAEFSAMGENGGDDSGGETEKTLSSISATYSGGNVPIGTAVTALTGIVVTAHYSDGSTETVTEYTLSGTIAEGSNTVTVTYESMTTTFTVTGISADVPCTGITLDKSELSIDSTGTQTITATVTPSDTTDSVDWVSSAPTVALITVEGNTCTVRGIGDGNAVITATCGSHSASCAVTVNGFAKVLNWTETPTYNINTSDGELKSGDRYVSDMVGVEKGYRYAFDWSETDGSWGIVANYKDDGTYIDYVQVAASPIELNVLDSSDVGNVRLGIHPNSDAFDLTKCVLKNCGIFSGNKMGIIGSNGAVSSGTNSVTLQKIPVDGGATYVFRISGVTATWKAIARYAADGTFIGMNKQGETTDDYEMTLEENTAFVRLQAQCSDGVPADSWEFVKVE